jgi:hypothetical protein
MRLNLSRLSRIALVALIAIILGGCSSSNKFAASFGKRKYMKGYYMNKPSGNETVSVSEPNKVILHIASGIKPGVAAKKAILAENLTKGKETNVNVTNLVRAIMAEPETKTLIQDKKVEKSIKTIAGDDYRRQNNTERKKIGGGLLFALIFVATLAVLIILAVLLVSVSAPYNAILLLLALLLIIVAVILLVSIASNNNIPSDVTVPLIEVLFDAFFAILGGIR